MQAFLGKIEIVYILIVVVASQVHLPPNQYTIYLKRMCLRHMGFPGGSDGKESACDAGGWGSVPGLERFPGEGNGNPF